MREGTMNWQEEVWSGPFGDAYHEHSRNSLHDQDIANRKIFWDIVHNQLLPTPKSYFEFGAGMGANLVALQQLGVKELYAVDVNEKARDSITKIGAHINESPNLTDVAYTMGVLIHVHPDNLKSVMGRIFTVSKKYILCGEYFSPECMTPSWYLGPRDSLWYNDFGTIWMENFPLKLISYGFLWDRATGLDNVTYWIFEKTQ